MMPRHTQRNIASTLSVALLLVLSAAVLPATAAPSSTGPITIASLIVHELLSPTTVTDLNLYLAGLDAGIAEVNAKGGVRGRPLQLTPANTTESNQTARYQSFITETIPAAAAVVGGRYDTDNVSMAIARTSSVPIIGSRTVTAAFYSGPQGTLSKSSLLVHQDLNSEMYQLLNFAVRGRHRCYAFGMVLNSEMPQHLFDVAANELQRVAFPRPAKITAFMNDTQATLYDRLKASLDSSALNITCIIILSLPEHTKWITDGLNANAPEYRNVDMTTGAAVKPKKEMYIFATSFSDWRGFTTGPADSPPSTSVPYRFTYFSQSYPVGTDSTMTVTQNFRTALDKVIANSSLRSVTFSGAVPYALSTTTSDNYGHDAMLGYLSVRFATELLFRAANTSDHESILNAAFQSRMFPLDDFVIGPFTDGCVGAETNATGVCRCNSGSRTLYTTSVGAGGRQVPIVDDPALFESEAARIEIPLTQCRRTTAFKHQIAIVLAPIDLNHPAEHVAAHRKQVTYWASYAMELNKKTTVTEVLPYPLEVDAITSDDLITLKKRVNYVSLVASSVPVPESQAATMWQVGQFSYYLPEQDEPYGPIATYSILSWRIVPVLADTIHTSVDYARALGRLTAIHLYVDTNSALSLAQRSLETFGASAFASITVLSSATATISALPTSGFVLVASQKPAVVQAVQTLAIAAAASTAASQMPTIVLAGSEYLLEDNLNTDPTNPVLLVSGLRSYQAGNATTSYGRLFTEVGGVMANTVIDASSRIDDAIFAAGAIATASGTLTPLSRDSCGLTQGGVWPHPGGTCQCRKGLNTFYVRPVNTWSNPQPQQVHQYRHSACGVHYTQLVDDSLTSGQTLGIIVGAAAGAVAIAIGVAAVVYLNFCRPSGRDNKNAPKDERQPFAMVFTDIQASTTLWARAPQHMGLGLDTHHTVLRSLIAKHRGYEVKTIGDSFMVAFHAVEPATKFALDIQSALFDESWGTDLFDETYKEMAAVTQEGEDNAATAQSFVLDPIRSFNEKSPTTATTKSPQQTFAAAANASFESPTKTGATGVMSNGHDDEYNHDVWNGIRVRVGVHFGNGNIRQDETSKGYDYYGTVVNTAARVEGVGHGGQVLLTQDAYDSLTSGGATPMPPTKAIVTDLGPQPLRGLDEPVPLYQLTPPRFAGRTFPPLRLDKEIVVEQSSSSSDVGARSNAGGRGGGTAAPGKQSGTNDESTDTASKRGGKHSGTHSTAAITVDSLVCESLRRRHVDLPHSIVVLLHKFAYHLLSTSTPSYRKGVIKHLGEKWRVGSHVSRWMRPYQANVNVGADQVLLSQLVIRAVRTMNVSTATLGCVGRGGASPSPSGDERGGGCGGGMSGGGGGCRIDGSVGPMSPTLIIGSALTVGTAGKRFSTSSAGSADRGRAENKGELSPAGSDVQLSI